MRHGGQLGSAVVADEVAEAEDDLNEYYVVPEEADPILALGVARAIPVMADDGRAILMSVDSESSRS